MALQLEYPEDGICKTIMSISVKTDNFKDNNNISFYKKDLEALISNNLDKIDSLKEYLFCRK